MKNNLQNLILPILLLVNISASGQHACGTAISIPSLPFSATNLSTSSANIYNASAACSEEFNDEAIYIFKYNTPNDEQITINVSTPFVSVPTGIYVFGTCTQPLTQCIAFAEGEGDPFNLNLVVSSGQDYYIVIATDGAENFDIAISKEVVVGVAINKAIPTQTFDVNGAIRIGEGTTTPYAGTLKWNNTNGKFQGYDGSLWRSISTPSINDLEEGQYSNIDHNLFLGDINLLFGFNLTGNATGNVAIGDDAGANNLGEFNTFLGYQAGTGFNGDDNVVIGKEAGWGTFGSTNKNVLIGQGAGLNGNIIDGNVLIGFRAGSESFSDLQNKLIIDNNNQGYNYNSRPLIYGDFTDNFLVINGTSRTTPNDILSVSGGGIINTLNINNHGGFFSSNNIEFSKGNSVYSLIRASSGTFDFNFTYSDANMEFDNEGNLDITGNLARKAIAGSWIANSDHRLKKNIKPLDSHDMLVKVLEMQGVNYEWNDDKTDFVRPEGLQIGFIAQDLQKIWPEKIIEDELGYLQTAYGDYDPVFVEAIKALAEKVEKQSIEIELLKKEMKALKARDGIILSVENK